MARRRGSGASIGENRPGAAIRGAVLAVSLVLLAALAAMAGAALAAGAGHGPNPAAGGRSAQYVNAIATLHETAGGKAIASIMPATPVTILKEQGDVLQVEVTGWSPMGGARYLFKDVGLRISLALLGEDGVGRRVVVGTRDDAWGSSWEQVKVTGWLDKKDVVPDIAALWQEASKLYYTRCSRCHSLRRPGEFSANQWPTVLKIMTKRAGLSPQQAALVTVLLQSRGKDQKSHDLPPGPAARATPQAAAEIPGIAGTPQLAAEGAALFESAGCGACHGEDAKTPAMPEYPRLAGQSAEYLYKQILDFKDGRRTNDAFSAMKDTVTPLSQQDAQAIAYWLSTL